MTATAHALIGAAIGYKIGNPYITVPLAFFSHFILDKIPHWDSGVDKTRAKRIVFMEAVFDSILGPTIVVLFLYYFKHPNPLYILLPALAGPLPDWWEIPHVVFNKNWFFSKEMYLFQHWIHDFLFNSRLNSLMGVLTQIITIAIFLLWSSK